MSELGMTQGNTTPSSTEQESSGATIANQRPVRSALFGVLATLLIFQGFLFSDTYLSMVSIWLRSDTFAHGFLIVPISIWLIWQKREVFSEVKLEVNGLFVPILLALVFAWVLGRLGDVLVVQQFAVVLMLPTLLGLMLGFSLILSLLFPLAFLLFAVPFGEFLTLPMMEFTADFTVGALRLTGIPVFREGMFFSLPTGYWSVVEACSGVRYMLASLTLGCLYAYLSYRKTWKRLTFVAFSIVLPIFANGVRAYMIVMIGHLSNMELATGVDHLIYGWVWFGVVIFFMFWVGSFWREDLEEGKQAESVDGFSNAEQLPHAQVLSPAPVVVSAALAVILMLSGPWTVQQVVAKNDAVNVQLAAASTLAGWQRAELSVTEWKPDFITPTARKRAVYVNGQDQVDLAVYYYDGQMHEGKTQPNPSEASAPDAAHSAELINSLNQLVSTQDDFWRQLRQSSIAQQLAEETEIIREAHIDSRQQNILVWYWYVIGGEVTTNPYMAKVYEVLAQLKGEGKGGYVVFMTAEFEDEEVEARSLLERFLGDTWLELRGQLIQAKTD